MTAGGRFDGVMKMGIEKAKVSLREGNDGIGAVIIRDSNIIAQAHNTGETQTDPTAHAEMSVIRAASAKIGKDLSACTIVSRHEPCPMCAGAIV